MEDLELLRSKTRPVKLNEFLPTFSYSKLDLFDQCKYKYKLKYIDKNYDHGDAIHFDLGNLAHKCMELRGRALATGERVNYDYLTEVYENGIQEETDKGTEKIIGVKDIKKKFFEDYYMHDNATGMNYEEKSKLFLDVVIKEPLDNGWHVAHNELPFEFVYKYGEHEDGASKEVKLHGFIDEVQINDEGNYRIIDFKTSKKIYDSKKLPTALQQAIYNMAIFVLFDKLPIENQYHFIYINEKQFALTKGYIKRVCKKLDKLLNMIDELEKTGLYKPNQTPLCYFCPYNYSNPKADPKTKSLCPYYSLWTPTNKTYQVNQVWEHDPKATNILTNNSAVQSSPNKSGRKLVF